MSGRRNVNRARIREKKGKMARVTLKCQVFLVIKRKRNEKRNRKSKNESRKKRKLAEGGGESAS